MFLYTVQVYRNNALRQYTRVDIFVTIYSSILFFSLVKQHLQVLVSANKLTIKFFSKTHHQKQIILFIFHCQIKKYLSLCSLSGLWPFSSRSKCRVPILTIKAHCAWGVARLNWPGIAIDVLHYCSTALYSCRLRPVRALGLWVRRMIQQSRRLLQGL